MMVMFMFFLGKFFSAVSADSRPLILKWGAQSPYFYHHLVWKGVKVSKFFPTLLRKFTYFWRSRPQCWAEPLKVKKFFSTTLRKISLLLPPSKPWCKKKKILNVVGKNFLTFFRVRGWGWVHKVWCKPKVP